MFPEWSDAEVNAEKWASKTLFEDTEMSLQYPLKRPSEFMESPVIVTPGTQDELFNKGEETSLLFQKNSHLDDYFQNLLYILHYLYDKRVKDDFYPWEMIYPKSKDGLPSYNPSGKYYIKLFALGSWRRITVDDRIPFVDEKPHLLVSHPNELWTLLLSKALLKVTDNPACILTAIRGYYPETIPMDPMALELIKYNLEHKLEINTKKEKGQGKPIPYHLIMFGDLKGKIVSLSEDSITFKSLNGLSEGVETVTFEDFLSRFSKLTIFHPTTAYKTCKHWQAVNDTTPRVPMVLSSTEEAKIIVNFSSLNPSCTLLMGGKYKVANGKLCFLTLKAGESLQLSTDANLFSATFLSREDFNVEEEELGVKHKEFEEVCPNQTGPNTVVLFKYIFHIKEKTVWGANCFVPDSVVPGLSLVLFNNDTLAPLASTFYTYPKVELEANKNGYTLVAQVKIQAARPAFKWKAKVYGTPAQETLCIKPIVQDVAETCKPTKRGVLFRTILKCKDAPVNHVSILCNQQIELTLFDNDVPVASSKNRGVLSAFLFNSEEAKAKMNPFIKHKYVLQGSIQEPIKELNCQLRYMSMEQLQLAKDTEREDKQKAVKDSWEAANPGRAARAAHFRDTHCKAIESGTVLPIQIDNEKPWSLSKLAKKVVIFNESKKLEGDVISANFNYKVVASNETPIIMSPQMMESFSLERKASSTEFDTFFTEYKTKRQQERALRSTIKALDPNEEKMLTLDKYNKMDATRRDAYRTLVLKEQEELMKLKDEEDADKKKKKK